MNRSLLSFSASGAVGVALVALVLYRCAPDVYNPVDPAYVGDYRIVGAALPPDVFAFTPYRTAYAQGRDHYVRIRGFTAPAGALDTTHFLYGLDGDSLSIYFTRPVTGTLYLEGVRPNRHRDTVALEIAVHSPFTLKGPGTVLDGDSARFSITPRMGGERARTQVRGVTWFVDGVPADTTRFPDEPFAFLVEGGEVRTIGAELEDLRGNRMRLDDVSVNVSRDRPRIVSFQPSRPVFSPGDNLAFKLTLAAPTGDSAVVVVAAGGDTARTGVFFTTQVEEVVVDAFARTLADTGSFTATALLTTGRGFSSHPATATWQVATSGPLLSLAAGEDTIMAGIGMAYEFSVIGSARQYVWVFSDGFSDTTTTARLTRTVFSDSSGPVVLRVHGVDDHGFAGAPVTMTIRAVRYFHAARFTAVPGAVKIHDTLTWEVAVDPLGAAQVEGGTFRWVLTSTDGDTLADTAAAALYSFTHVATDSMSATLRFLFTDAQGLNANPLLHTVTVRLLRPVLRVGEFPLRAFAGRAYCIPFTATDSAGQVDSVVLVWEGEQGGGRVVVDGNHTTLCFTPTAAGAAHLLLWAVDNDGLHSDTLRRSLTVESALPVVTGIDVNVDTLYRAVPVRFTAAAMASPTGASLSAYRWRFTREGGGAQGDDTVTAARSITRAFEDAGTYLVELVCVDSLGSESLPYVLTVTVDAGIPVVHSLALPDSVFAATPFTVTVTASDNPGGSIDSFVVVLVAGSDSIAFGSPSPSLRCSLPVEQAGTWEVSAMVRDDLGQWSHPVAAPESLVVVRGDPVVVSLARQTQTIWMLYEAVFEVTAASPRGVIRALYCDWGDDSISTIQLDEPTASVTRVIRHTWTTWPPDGEYLVSVTALDDEGVVSAPRQMTVSVHEGRPVIAIAGSDSTVVTDDTLFVPFLAQTGRYGYGPQTLVVTTSAHDSNGTVERWFYNAEGISDTSVGGGRVFGDAAFRFDTLSAFQHNDPDLLPYPPDVPKRVSVLCVDNDGLVGAVSFYLVVDPPPSPITSLDVAEASGGSISQAGITVQWIGGVDGRDGDSTRIQIEMAYNEWPGDPMDATVVVDTFVLKDATPGGQDAFSRYVTIPDEAQWGDRLQIRLTAIDRVKNSVWRTVEYPHTLFPF